jgi:hypothetical protein
LDANYIDSYQVNCFQKKKKKKKGVKGVDTQLSAKVEDPKVKGKLSGIQVEEEFQDVRLQTKSSLGLDLQ